MDNSTFLSKSPFFVKDQYTTFRGIERKCCSAFLPRLEQRSEDEPTRGYLTEIMDKCIWTLEYVVSIYLNSAHYRNTWPETALLHKLESFLLFPFSNYSLIAKNWRGPGLHGWCSITGGQCSPVHLPTNAIRILTSQSCFRCECWAHFNWCELVTVKFV